MNRLFVPSMGVSDWRRLLADPQKHWKPSKSAFESAVAWEAARKTDRGLPPDIERLLNSKPDFAGASLLLGVPEHHVALEGGGHPSQTDLWALIATAIGVVSVAVEAKAGESFDKTVEEWILGMKPNSGKPTRLTQLCKLWRLTEKDVAKCRYQLMHRPAAAILEAKRFRLKTALFLVHAFGKNEDSFADYTHWLSLLGTQASVSELQRVGEYEGVALWTGWVNATPATDASVRAAI